LIFLPDRQASPPEDRDWNRNNHNFPTRVTDLMPKAGHLFA